jgi:predicted ATP-dependent endonuclease of OLD family
MKLKEIHIKRFRGIKDQIIKDIDNALVLIGKNNAGKSAFITAIRTLFGDYTPQVKDIYNGEDDFAIEAVLKCSDGYLLDFFLDNKIGFEKVPSSTADFNNAKAGTIFEENTFTEFKNKRNEVIDSNMQNDVSTRDDFEPIWINAIKNKFNIAGDEIGISLLFKRNTSKVEYISNKDVVNLLPSVAFIDDSRNFEEEETGKTKTITANIFNTILKSELISDTETNCKDCNREDCDRACISTIGAKEPMNLSIEELQKLINYKTKNSSAQFTSSISERFAKNYQDGFKVNIKATSNIDKSFSIITKLFDPALNAEVELSNVGAGVRSVYILSLLQSFQAIKATHTIFIIEEPELYLHPELQKSMAKTLSEIAENNQVIFTTHSPVMLREFSTSNIRKIKLNEENYCSIAENTTIDDVLTEIGYSSQDILNTDFVLFVEGPDDKTIMELVLNKYYDIDLERVSIIDTKSCNNIGFYATLRFLEKTTISDEFAIIRDADTKPEDMVKRILMQQLDSNVDNEFASKAISKTYITKFSSIEGYLFSAELLAIHNIYTNEEQVYERLKNRLTENKEKCLRYFRKQNENEQERIDLFESEYDSKIADAKENLDWIKTNIKGHTYFGFTESKRINYENYVKELPQDAFADLVEFFDNIPYFLSKKRN